MALKLSFQLVFLLILASTVAAVTATEDEEMITESKECVQEMQKHPLTICRMFLKYGGDSAGRPFLRYESGKAEDQIKCCEQLHQVSDACRCELLNMMTREIMTKDMKSDQCHGQCEEMRMRGVFLPLMCKIGPPCPLSYGGGDAAVVKY